MCTIASYLFYGRLSIPNFMTPSERNVMFDTKGIYDRYASCYNAKSSGDLAQILGIARQTTNDWKNGISKVPWWRLKELVNLQGMSWDWLLCGEGDRHSPGKMNGEIKEFDIKGINNRFLSLFPTDWTQAELARHLNVSQVTVHKWQNAQEQVSWQRLAGAKNKHQVTWDWIIEGRGDVQYDCFQG